MSRLFREGSTVALSALILLGASLPVCAEPDRQEKSLDRELRLPASQINSIPASQTKADEESAKSKAEERATVSTPGQGPIFLRSICREIGSAAAVHDLPPSFLTKLIWQESRFDPRAVSRAGAQGIAQFMPGTARWRGLADPFDPHLSVWESARWLSELRNQFGNLGLAAAAYNAGPGRVQEWLDGKRGLPPETQAYVRIVTGRAAVEWIRPGVTDYNSLLPESPDCRIRDLIRAAAFRTLSPEPPGTRKRPGQRKQPARKRPAWSLQLIGDSSEARALKEYKNLQKRFPAILGSRPPVLIKRQLGGRGRALWYQVRVAENSRGAATALCSRLRSAGGQCLVLNN